MALEQKIMEALKQAMKDKNEGALRALRAIKSALLLEKTSANATEINEGIEIKLLQKLIKQRKESLSIYQTQGRDDLSAKEIEEIQVIETFLPKAMSEEEITIIVKDIITNVQAQGMKDMGKVMAQANIAIAGRADSASISSIVKQCLSV